ncbi:hypothetical protein FJTKL_00151 [Diaporthe vaccinii]|uniref:Uncharacterized protein n=1 Tax=Diaporthe vaccinii TaxID=105482 RepID=A0ABR4E4H9_9PEZI
MACAHQSHSTGASHFWHAIKRWSSSIRNDSSRHLHPRGLPALSRHTHTHFKVRPAQPSSSLSPQKMIVVNTRGSLLPVISMKPFVHVQIEKRPRSRPGWPSINAEKHNRTWPIYGRKVCMRTNLSLLTTIYNSDGLRCTL